MANGNGSNVWLGITQIIVTIVLAALAAFGGVWVGLGEANVQLATSRATNDAMRARLDRIEDKLDRLIENRMELPTKGRSR